MADLIITDRSRIDRAVIIDYKLDCSFGDSDNTFELTVDDSNNIMNEDEYFYMENTSICGRVDSVEHDTDSMNIIYRGRTAQGLLSQFCIRPAQGHDYVYIQGTANEVVQEIIELGGAQDIFVSAFKESSNDIEIELYESRHDDCFNVLNTIAKRNNCKLVFTWREGYIEVSMELSNDYGLSDQFDITQVDYSITKTYNNPNHYICLGSGELKDRHVIDLYLNDNGDVMPYARVDNPVEDADYIFTDENQVIKGDKQNTKIFEYNSAPTVKTYLPLIDKPKQWSTNYVNYFYIEDREETDSDDTEQEDEDDSDIRYVQFKRTYKDTFVKLTTQPSDWYSRCMDYYYMNDKGKPQKLADVKPQGLTLLSSKPRNWSSRYADYYNKNGSHVKPVAYSKYHAQKKQPKDWKKKYNSYYYKYNNGTEVVMKSCEGVSKHKYVKLTQKPTRWQDEGYDKYYVKCNCKLQDNIIVEAPVHYEKVSTAIEKYQYYWLGKKGQLKWMSNTYYRLDNYTVAPNFTKFQEQVHGKVYSKTDHQKAPTFTKDKYYKMTTFDFALPFQSGKYYRLDKDKEQVPKWSVGTYYKEYQDNYKELIASCISHIEETANSDEFDIDLNLDEAKYDVGDFISVKDDVTNQTVKKAIKQCVLTVESGYVTVNYRFN